MSHSASARTVKILSAATFFMVLSADRVFAQGIPHLGPEDTAIAIDLDSVFVPAQNNGRYPGGEAPSRAIDNNAQGTSSKYLNFGGAGSGFIVSPTILDNVEAFQIRTANDAVGRDPASWALYGFNGALTTTDSGPDPAINQTGQAEAWTLIGSGSLSLPGNPAVVNDQRLVWGSIVDVPDNTPAYQHYKMIFPTVKTAGSIMQIDEIQFFRSNDGNPSGQMLTPGLPIIAVDETPVPAGWGGPGGSSFPGNEAPARGIDQSKDPVTTLANTKYLNFGEERSGIIITNSGGPIKVDIMELVTGNDAPDRDPASYLLYGTNDPITSEQNSNSNGSEVWTLISEGPLVLPTARQASTLIPVNSANLYTSYRLVFPTVKNATGANSMQISDIQFYTVPEPSTMALGLGGLALLATRRRRA